MLQINVGCGEFRAEGWLNVDIYSGGEGQPKPDIIASAENLPFADGMVDRLYAGHVLEHIEFDMVPEILREFRRVLSPIGGLLVVGPDLDRAEESYPDEVEPIKTGAHRWPGDAHLWHSRGSTMLELLQNGGFDVAEADIGPVFLSGQWPITSGVGWQFAIFATKIPEDT
jgi:predicted SAM-dependent methyltransferase